LKLFLLAERTDAVVVIAELNALSQENTQVNVLYIIHTVARIDLLLQVKVEYSGRAHSPLSSYLEVPGSDFGPETELLLHSLPSLQENSGIIPQIKPRPLPFTYAPVKLSLILSLEAMYCELVKAGDD
jgi:hypothetical protein